MPNTYGIDLLDVGVVRNDEVDELGDELVGCRLAHKKPDVLESIGSPRAQDQETNEYSAKGVKVPYYFASDDGHGQAEGVDDDVVAVINKEDMHRRVTAEEETVDA